jgi:hypothetical protein
VLRANLKWKLVSQLVGSCLALMLAIGTTGCDDRGERLGQQSVTTTSSRSMMTASSLTDLTTTDGPLSEVNIPDSISRLAPNLEQFQPQVQILSPKPDEILSDDRVTVKFQLNDLPLFKHPDLGLGNHLHVILDKQNYRGVYDLNQPLVFKNLAAGTHTLRVFASRPWHESFKNEGAFAQTTFHVLTKTPENNPDRQKPLLTYSRPAGTYSAEPIMLDYYLTNAPSHLVASGSSDRLPDWRIRVTVNDQRFILDRWAPIYLQGFKPGKNWVRLELVDDRGNPIPNVYNDTVGLVTYDPQTKDALAKLIRGELNPNLARTLVEPGYVAIEPKPAPVPTPIPTPSAAPIPTSPPTPTSTQIVPSPIVTAPLPVTKPSPRPEVITAPIVRVIPSPRPEPVQMPASTEPRPIATPIVRPTIPVPPTSTPVATPPALPPAIAPPIIVAKPSPAPQPTPEAASQPLPIPSPIFTPKPTPSIAPVLPSTPPRAGLPLNSAPQQPPSYSPVTTPIAPATPIVGAEKTWQQQAGELLKVAGVKTREFTNTIPSKAQRFGQNVRVWAGNAMDTIQAWRARNSENQT